LAQHVSGCFQRQLRQGRGRMHFPACHSATAQVRYGCTLSGVTSLSEKVRHLLSLYKLALGVDGTQGTKRDSFDQSYLFRTARPLTNFPKPTTGKGLTKNVGWLLLYRRRIGKLALTGTVTVLVLVLY
jgi:hypothetical protein